VTFFAALVLNNKNLGILQRFIVILGDLSMENIFWTAGAFALFFVCLGVKIILLKDGKFSGSCSSQNVTGDGSCSICGRSDRSGCENDQDEAMKEILKAETTSS